MEIRDLIKEDTTLQVDGNKKYIDAANRYCELCGCDISDITKDTIYDSTLNKVARECGILDLKELEDYILKKAEKKLTEDTPTTPDLADKIADEQDVTVAQADAAVDMAQEIEKKTGEPLDIVYVEGDLERRLNRCYDTAMRAHKRGELDKFAVNLCIVGSVGGGKTERLKTWCKHKGLRFISFKGDELTIDDIKQVPVGEDPNHPGKAKLVDMGTFTPLESEDPDDLYVLYIDEYNRCDPTKRTFWFKLMDEHIIPDPSNVKTRTKYLPNLLFTVVTINPAVIKTDGDSEMDSEDEAVSRLTPAELNRLRIFQLKNDNLYNLSYFREYYKKDTQRYPEDAAANAGRLAIATQLLTDPNFVLVDDEEINAAVGSQIPFLTMRSLKTALQDCNGTKEDFLEALDEIVGAKAKKMIQTILKEYDDVDDTPNKVWDFWKSYGIELAKPEQDAETAEKGKATLKKMPTGIDKLRKMMR